MKKLISFCLMVLMFFCGSNVVLAALPTKGVQAVLLHLWGPASVRNLSNVLRNYSKSEVEVSFAPNTSASTSDPYNNIKTIITNLNGKKKLFVAVYLGFHSYHSSTCNATSSRAANSDLTKFVSFFNAYKDNPMVVIIVSPSLEDCGSKSDVETSALEIAQRIGAADIGKLILRRSPGTDSVDAPSQCYSDSTPISCTMNPIYRYRAVEIEKHGVTKDENGNYHLNTSGANVYSNDGVFVWDNVSRSRETKGSFPNADTSITQKYSVTDFTSQTDGIRTNLWRPSYNMFRDANGDYLDKTHRTFRDDNNWAFNSIEMKVLEKFLDPSTSKPSRLITNAYLTPGDNITSNNDEVTLMFQLDGNVVLYNNDTGQALWHTCTGGRTDATSFIMQSDGNLVLYAGNMAPWNAGIISPNAYLLVQDDHNLVIYSNNGGALWWTETTMQPNFSCRGKTPQ